eukprot:TRINITY_DN9107_c0_g1_i1.p1 TRINITY_DN9107_c0_g1~~TRINITY_DN9107_c0_g1_i1.p1  ORF type:complete len:492 (+),score=121.29 TRINITY_DN9107_c0_g1_i1:188-1663(+)
MGVMGGAETGLAATMVGIGGGALGGIAAVSAMIAAQIGYYKRKSADPVRVLSTATTIGMEVELVPPTHRGQDVAKGTVIAVTHSAVVVRFDDEALGEQEIPREYFDGPANATRSKGQAWYTIKKAYVTSKCCKYEAQACCTGACMGAIAADSDEILMRGGVHPCAVFPDALVAGCCCMLCCHGARICYKAHKNRQAKQNREAELARSPQQNGELDPLGYPQPRAEHYAQGVPVDHSAYDYGPSEGVPLQQPATVDFTRGTRGAGSPSRGTRGVGSPPRAYRGMDSGPGADSWGAPSRSPLGGSVHGPASPGGFARRPRAAPPAADYDASAETYGSLPRQPPASSAGGSAMDEFNDYYWEEKQRREQIRQMFDQGGDPADPQYRHLYQRREPSRLASEVSGSRSAAGRPSRRERGVPSVASADTVELQSHVSQGQSQVTQSAVSGLYGASGDDLSPSPQYRPGGLRASAGSSPTVRPGVRLGVGSGTGWSNY